MIAAPGPALGDQPAAETQDAWCWREASRLRRELPHWVIIWLSPAHEFRAYARLPGARRDTALTAPTPARLAALIGQVERAAGRTPHDLEDLT
jgi:hypothetical protein